MTINKSFRGRTHLDRKGFMFSQFQSDKHSFSKDKDSRPAKLRSLRCSMLVPQQKPNCYFSEFLGYYR